MKLKQYLIDSKMMGNTMIGLGIDHKKLKKHYDYIESWLQRFKIPYEKVKEPHFTVAQITGTYPKDDLVREVNSIPSNVKFNPKGLKIFRGVNVPKDFIVLEYKPNNKFIEMFNKIASDYEIRFFPGIKPHTSLFMIKQNVMDDELFRDMEYSLPKLPVLVPKDVELWNQRFEKEYTK